MKQREPETSYVLYNDTMNSVHGIYYSFELANEAFHTMISHRLNATGLNCDWRLVKRVEKDLIWEDAS